MKNNKKNVKPVVLPCGKCGSYHVCGECVHMDFDRRYGSQFYCRAEGEYEYPDNSAAGYCKHFVEK